jgi:hypothetical protein
MLPVLEVEARILCATSVESESRHHSARLARELHDANGVADEQVLGSGAIPIAEFLVGNHLMAGLPLQGYRSGDALSLRFN